MESTKFSNGGSNDVESTDGGTFACNDTGLSSARCQDASMPGNKPNLIYEIGNDPGLDL